MLFGTVDNICPTTKNFVSFNSLLLLFKKFLKYSRVDSSKSYALSLSDKGLFSGYHYCTTSFNKAWTQVLRRLKSCSRRFGDSRWWGSLKIFLAGNNAKRLRRSTIPQSSSSVGTQKLWTNLLKKFH